MKPEQDTFQILNEDQSGFLPYEIGVLQKSIIGNSRVYQADCMDLLRQTPDNYYSLCVVDPPYGLGIDGQKESINKNPKHNRKEHEKKNWDTSIPGGEYFTELFRVSKNQIIWGGNYFVQHFTSGNKGWIVWYKGQEGLTMSDAELAYSSFSSPTRVVKINRVELLKDGTFHPTQKPVKLYSWLFQNYAKPNDKILDTHLGSGSSRIAAHQMGFDFIGFEIDKEYFEAQEKRFKEVTSQLRIAI